MSTLVADLTNGICSDIVGAENHQSFRNIAILSEENLVASGVCKTHSEAALLHSLLSATLLANYMSENPPKVFSLTAGILVVDEIFFEHFDQLDFCPIRWPLQEAPEFARFFEYQKGGFTSATVFDRFVFINPSTGTIKIKNGAKDYLINYLGFDERECDGVLKSMASLTGSVLCWGEPPSQNSLREFFSRLEHLGFPSIKRILDKHFGPLPKTDLDEPKRTSGRPSLSKEIADSYRETFSDTEIQPPLAFAARRLGYDRKTVRKALVEHGLWKKRGE